LTPTGAGALVAPLFQPYSVAEALDDRQNDLYLPIASNHCGVALFVDLREGRGSGLVGSWDNVEGADDAVHWDSVADMLTDIADALSYGHPAMIAYAGRRLRRYAGSTVEATIYRAATTPDGRIRWDGEELHPRLAT
jgi:hypothetical protein